MCARDGYEDGVVSLDISSETRWFKCGDLTSPDILENTMLDADS